MADKADVVLIGVPKKLIFDGLKDVFTLHIADHSTKAEPLLANVGSRIRGAAVTGAPEGRMNGAMMALCPKLEFVSSFGVGYDNIDIKHSVEHGIVVCNTPEVLNEEVADTALGLLLCTVREFPKAENFLRAGKWTERQYPLSKATLRNRTVGMVGMGRIGRAIARRLDGFGVPVVYHSRNPQQGASYKHYPKLLDMARDVDTLILITPGGPSTKHLVNAEVLDALGPNGIVINMARGTVVDDDALIPLPVDPATVLERIGRLRAAPLLLGGRGRPRVDVAALAELATAVADAAIVHKASATAIARLDVRCTSPTAAIPASDSPRLRA